MSYEEKEEGAGESQETEETEEIVEPEETTETSETELTEPRIEDGYIVYPDGNKIPVERFEKVYGQGKEHERTVQETQDKLTLLQTNPEEYYRKFPNEKVVPPESEKNNLSSMVVTGGEFDGQTLSEVYQRDPVEAQKLQFDFMVQQKDTATKEESDKAKWLEESNAEVNAFGDARAQEFFKKDMSTLTADETKQVEALIGNTIAWGKETGRGGGKIEDMYFLMNQKSMLSSAKGEGIRSLIDGQVKSVPSTASGGKADSGQETGYAKFSSMTEDQLAVAIGNMSDEQYLKFKKDAPDDLKRKHSSMPW